MLVGFAIVSAYDLRRAGIALLILGSLFFYAWWNWHYLFLFGFSIAFNYWWSLLLAPGAEGQRTSAHRRRMLGIGVAVNLALLGYFKYRNFAFESAGAALGRHWQFAPLILPLAVSFFTFEQITYLVGAYQGEDGHGDFLSYSLFITFFPHLIAGPIVRYYEIYPQLNRRTRFRLGADNLSAGLMIFAIGLFKKVMLADTFRVFVGPIFDHMPAVSFFDAWGAALAFALQIYFDFSGYSDMAIGLARMFNVKFPENFDSPYQSRDIIQFWRRWHITLSYFLRDYLYIPLGGNRRGELRRHINLMITMVLGGLWHGANWTFLLWGAAHGVMLSINHLWESAKWRMPAGRGVGAHLHAGHRRVGAVPRANLRARRAVVRGHDRRQRLCMACGARLDWSARGAPHPGRPRDRAAVSESAGHHGLAMGERLPLRGSVCGARGRQHFEHGESAAVHLFPVLSLREVR